MHEQVLRRAPTLMKPFNAVDVRQAVGKLLAASRAQQPAELA